MTSDYEQLKMGSAVTDFIKPAKPEKKASKSKKADQDSEEVDRLLSKFIKFDPNQKVRVSKKI